MGFQLIEPVVIIGVGGIGAKLASKAKESLNADCLVISNDKNDLQSETNSIKVSTEGIVNPSMYLIRGAAQKVSNEIQEVISNYSTVIIMANLAGKSGAAISPIVSSICKESNKNTISFAIMPFKYEQDRIFNSGISLKRLRADSECTIVLDNDALLDSNPDLTPNQCHDISNSSILCAINSLKNTSIPEETNILSTSRDENDLETSLKNSLKMLYENAPPNSVKRSMLYVLGGNNVPVGILNSITKITSGVFKEDNTRVDLSTMAQGGSKVMLVSSIQGKTRFDDYDPLGMIPAEKTLDWDIPDSSIDCKLDLQQLE